MDSINELREDEKCDVIREMFPRERLASVFYRTNTRMTVLVHGVIPPVYLSRLDQMGVYAEYKPVTHNTMLFFPRIKTIVTFTGFVDVCITATLVGMMMVYIELI